MIRRFVHTLLITGVLASLSGCLKKDESLGDLYAMLAQDQSIIIDYLREKHQDTGVVPHPSGLLYKIIKKGNERDTISPENVPTVIFSRKLLKEDRVIESSMLPTSFDGRKLKDHIAAWQIGLRLITKGGKIKLYVPSPLAFGQQGVPGIIPPNAILICDIELVDFK